MLVTVTSRLRVHRDEVICALVKGNTLHMRFVSMKPLRVPVDELTREARQWLLPALAPREIPMPVDEADLGDTEQTEEVEHDEAM